MTKIFKPVVCLKCGHPFVAQTSVFTELKYDEMHVADGIGFEGSNISCSQCGELHEYQVDKEKLTLQIVAVPVSYTGSSSKVFYPDDTLETVDQKAGSELIEAAKNGNYYEVNNLVERGVSVNTIDDEGNPVLYHSVAAGNLDIVRYLVEKGAEVDKPHSSGQIPLDRAAQEGYLEIVQYLANHGSPIHDIDTISPLHLAAQGGHLDVVKYLVDEKGLEVNNNYELGTPLHFAAGNGFLDIVRFLVEKGADTSMGSKLGDYTPIEMAKATLELMDELTNTDTTIRDDGKKRIGKVIRFLNGETEFGVPSPTCPRCGGTIVKLRRRRDGHLVLGCSAFPKCRFMRPISD